MRGSILSVFIICCVQFSTAQIIRLVPNQDEINLLLSDPCETQDRPVSFDYPGQQGGQFYILFSSGRICYDPNTGIAEPGFLEAYPGSNDPFEFVAIPQTVHNSENDSVGITAVRNLEVEHIVGPNENYENGYILHNDGFVDLSSGFPILSNGYSDWAWTTGHVGFRMDVYGEIHYGYITLQIVGGNNSSGFFLRIQSIYVESTADRPIVVGEIPACPSDVSQDGFTDIDDFILFNTSFGEYCDGCPEDMDGNGQVDVGDFLILNTGFDQECD